MRVEEQQIFPALANSLTGRHIEEFGEKVDRARTYGMTWYHCIYCIVTLHSPDPATSVLATYSSHQRKAYANNPCNRQLV